MPPCYHPKGFIIGHVDMIDCVSSHESEWFCGPYGFVFNNSKEFYREQWIPYKGKLGIFNVPENALEIYEKEHQMKIWK